MTAPYTVSTGSVVQSNDVNQLVNWINQGALISVKQYGATGNGVTDDTTAINLALADIPTSTGGILYFPPNSTYLTTGIDISAYSGNLVICGGGWSSILKLKNAANGYILKSTSGSMQGTRICNLMLDCNSANQTAASGGIYGYKYRRCLIDFVYILNPWQAGIYLIGAGGDFGYQNRISNCFIIGGSNTTTGTNAYGNGLRLENTDENTVYANHFEANGNFNDGTYGFHIYDQNGLSSYEHNSFVNGAGAIKLDGLQCRVSGNAFDGNGSNICQMNASAADTIFTNNTTINVGFRASGGTANSVNAIYCNAPRCIIQGNYFNSDTSATPKTNSFVRVDTGATDIVIEQNEFDIRTSSGTLSGAIIFVSGVPARTRIRDNVGFDNVNSRQSFVSEAHGTASITTGNTTVTVTHGLSITPTVDQISVTPTTSISTATRFWISSPNSTTFTINCDSNPGTTISFAWQAWVGW